MKSIWIGKIINGKWHVKGVDGLWYQIRREFQQSLYDGYKIRSLL
jgi:hypothetical protein